MPVADEWLFHVSTKGLRPLEDAANLVPTGALNDPGSLRQRDQGSR